MARPLEGLLVVALEQAVAAPVATMRLADAGARVIKIERAEGDFARGYDHVCKGESSYFAWLNRGKESLVLDIKQADDCALLDRLIARADIFIQNLAPGAAERAGLGSAALRARHTRLITCDVSGYGETGPMATAKAYDLLIQCESGLASVTGSPVEPGRVGVSAADICCGMNAHAAILEALLERGRTGAGSGVAVSLFDGMAEWMAVPLLHYDYGGKAPARVGIAHPSIAPYGMFMAAEAQPIVIAVQNEREWARFCTEVIARPDLAADPRFDSNARRCEHRAELDATIAAVLATLSVEEVGERLDRAQVAHARVNDVAGLSAHPHLRRIEVASAGGSLRLPAPAARWTDDDRRYGSVPTIGEQSQAIRQEFAG